MRAQPRASSTSPGRKSPLRGATISGPSSNPKWDNGGTKHAANKHLQQHQQMMGPSAIAAAAAKEAAKLALVANGRMSITGMSSINDGSRSSSTAPQVNKNDRCGC